MKNKLLGPSFSLLHFQLRLQVELQVSSFCVLPSAGSQRNGPILTRFHIEIGNFRRRRKGERTIT
jgi:hypothetical protein